MARIPILEPQELTAAQRDVYDRIAGLRKGHVPGPYRIAIHNPELTDKWQMLGELLRYRTNLSPRLAELAILITARHHSCQHEWWAHEPLAIKAGLQTEIIEAIRIGRPAARLSSDQQAVTDFASELLETHFVSEPAYQSALAVLGVAGIVELTALVGYYVMVAMMLNMHGMPLPDGVALPLMELSE